MDKRTGKSSRGNLDGHDLRVDEHVAGFANGFIDALNCSTY
eukprot:CAMPEP_0183411752 /NCGR_PEP_ID=MMETSP0370-20130417/20532_2 /TAXON_ID=268820 /ORGANISM="Peridinium aciculiferum, Strain PAER-2" /LENGTH=40 /DNA_ID= /DNA_START= /DNA_END= /DNA_ORIENTATION=